jgi:hypothetical protein
MAAVVNWRVFCVHVQGKRVLSGARGLGFRVRGLGLLAQVLWGRWDAGQCVPTFDRAFSRLVINFSTVNMIKCPEDPHHDLTT